MDLDRMNRLIANPRSGFAHAIQDRDIARCLVKTAEIHGHYCPGSAFGVMATKTIQAGEKKEYCLSCAGTGVLGVDGRGIL